MPTCCSDFRCNHCSQCKILKPLFLLTSYYCALGNGYASWMLASHRKGGDAEVYQNAFASGVMNAGFAAILGDQFWHLLAKVGKSTKSIGHDVWQGSLPARGDVALLTLSAAAFFPTAYAVLSRIPLNYDSMKDREALTYFLIFLPSMFYALISSYMGMFGLLHDRIYKNIVHFMNLADDRYWQFYHLSQVLALREIELRDKIINLTQPDDSLSTALQSLSNNQLRRTYSESVLHHTAQVVTVSTCGLVLSIVPPTFQCLSFSKLHPNIV